MIRTPLNTPALRIQVFTLTMTAPIVNSFMERVGPNAMRVVRRPIYAIPMLIFVSVKANGVVSRLVLIAVVSDVLLFLMLPIVVSVGICIVSAKGAEGPAIKVPWRQAYFITSIVNPLPSSSAPIQKIYCVQVCPSLLCIQHDLFSLSSSHARAVW